MRLMSGFVLLPVLGLAASLAACTIPCDRDIPMIIGRPAPTAPAAGEPGQWRITRRDEILDHRIALLGEVVDQRRQPVPEGCPVQEDSVRLESRVDTITAAVRHQLRITHFDTTTSWHYWNTARVEGGETLVLHPLDRMVGECNADISLRGCRHNETFTVDLPDALLRSHARKDLRIETGAARGQDATYAFRPEHIQAQLAAVDALRQSLAASGGKR